MGDVVEQRDRRVEEAVGELHVRVREGEELFAQLRPVRQMEAAHTGHAVGRRAALHRAVRHSGVPAVVPVKVAHDLPHRLHRRVDNRASNDRYHRAT